MGEKRNSGALIGWKRNPSEHGIVLSLQTASSVENARNKQFDTLSLALNDRQLRSLVRDLQRAALERGVQLQADPRRPSLLSRLKSPWPRTS